MHTMSTARRAGKRTNHLKNPPASHSAVSSQLMNSNLDRVIRFQLFNSSATNRWVTYRTASCLNNIREG